MSTGEVVARTAIVMGSFGCTLLSSYMGARIMMRPVDTKIPDRDLGWLAFSLVGWLVLLLLTEMVNK